MPYTNVYLNININIDLLILYKVHRSLSKGTHLTAFALIIYGRQLHPPLLKNHLVLGRHRALMRNPSAKTYVLAVHDEAKVVATPTPQPQEDDMTINPTIQRVFFSGPC